VPGIGKTTLIRKVAAEMQQRRIGGFYTEEIRRSGQRQGFRLVTFNGKQGIIAHADFDHRHRVGKYGVDVNAIDRFADITLSISEDTDVYVVDEIGKMECLAPRFVSRMEALLSSDKVIIATVGKKGSGLIEKVKHWPDSQLWEITHENRDALVTQVIAWIDQRA
jgi:nucleoside-triphosphatase